jgi:DNA-binding response OmpR family regulator
MVVDADPVLSQMMVDLLERSGLRARLCHNGPEALSALRADDQGITPRLLLLDLDVHGIDGLGMLRELRIAGLLSQIKVLLMMARFSESDLRVALDIGVADVISKPLSTTLLLHRVRLLLGEEP